MSAKVLAYNDSGLFLLDDSSQHTPVSLFSFSIVQEIYSGSEERLPYAVSRIPA